MQLGQGSEAGRGYGATLSTPTPEVIERARVTDYIAWLSESRGVQVGPDYTGLWTWSVEQPAEFWSSIWDYFNVLGERGPGPVITGKIMPDIDWFKSSRVNYARNAL